MFDFVRSHNRLLQVMLGLIIIPLFVASGVQGYTHFFSEAAETVASVDGKEITRAEWDNQHRQAIDRMRNQHPNVDLKTLDTAAAKRETLDTIIRDRVMQAATFHEDLGASDERTKVFIATNPQFQQLRSLDKAQLTAVLAQQGMTPDSFFDRVKDELGKQQPLQGVSVSGIVPATATKAALDAWFDQREIQWQRFDTKDYLAAIQPTDAQVQAYYADKAHAAEFKAPEEAKIEYVVLDVEALKAQVKLADAALHEIYEQNKARYTVPEERRASHILVSVDKKAAPADVAKAKARAEDLLAQVRKAPASFADIAKKNSDDGGTKAEGGDLDFMRKGAIPGAFSDTLFSMKENDISNVVRSDAGFHVILMTGLRPGSVKSFDEVRPQIEDLYRAQEAQKLFATDADKFTNTVYEKPDSLQPAIDDFKLAKQTAVVHRTAPAGATGPLASARLLDAVFANESVRGKHNTEAVETGPSQLVSAHVVEYHPEHVRTLAEVHDQVVDSVRKAMATAAARKDGDARVAAAAKDPALALPLTATVGRMTNLPDVPHPVIDAALKADIAKGPVVTSVTLPDGSFAAIRVVKSVPRSGDEAQNAQAKTQVEQAFEEAESQAVFEAMKSRYKVKVDDKRVAKGFDTSASAPN